MSDRCNTRDLADCVTANYNLLTGTVFLSTLPPWHNPGGQMCTFFRRLLDTALRTFRPIHHTGPVISDPRARLIAQYRASLADQSSGFRQAVQSFRNQIPASQADYTPLPHNIVLVMDDETTIVSVLGELGSQVVLPASRIVILHLAKWNGPYLEMVKVEIIGDDIQVSVTKTPRYRDQSDRRASPTIIPPPPRRQAAVG